MNKTGIDVSEWQGVIDWQKVKSQIDFVILREGYRKTVDKYFFQNVTKCKENQIPIHGVYHFIYALNLSDVQAECESCLASIEKAGLPKGTYIWCDFEYDTVDNAKRKGVTLGRAQCNSFTKAFCDFFQKRGYRTGIYTNGDYYKNWYYQETIDAYPLWLADYTGEPDYTCVYQQYTSSGKVNGITGNVDMNYYFPENEEKGDTEDLLENTKTLMKSQVGYLEKASNSNLDSMTGNAGYANYTKYARDINNIGLMGCQGQPWCAVYQFWICWKIFGKSKALDIMGNGFYNCNSVKSHAKSNGTWHSTPKDGALVIFRNGAHIGRVISIKGVTIKTNEGNTSSGELDTVEANGGCVAEKRYTIGNSQIDGYVWIDYGEETSEPEAPWKATGTATSTVDNLFVRAEPNGEVIGELMKGNRFEINGVTSGSWTQVNVTNIGVGWVWTDYTKKDGSQTTAPPKQEITNKQDKTQRLFVGKVTASALNVRTWAGTEFPQIKSYPTLARGNLVDVMNYTQKATDGSDWYYIRIAGKYHGFVSAKYIQRQ